MQVTAPRRLKTFTRQISQPGRRLLKLAAQRAPWRNSKDPGVTEGISALAQDSTATPANCSVGSRSSLFNLEHRQGFGGKVFLQEKLWESPACKQKTRKILLLSCSLDGNQSIHIFIYYQVDYQWPLENRSGVCLFLCQTSLGHCRSKDSKPRSSPAERLCYQGEGLCPNTWNAVALPFLVQVVLCSHSQPRIPMKQSLELILNTWDGKGSSPFLQLIPVSSFSNILFLTRLKIKALPPRQPGHQNKTRLPLKCQCPAWKAALQKCPNLKCPTQQDTRQSSFKSWLSSVVYQECRSSSPPSPKIPHL